jgi:hypothetical protein
VANDINALFLYAVFPPDLWDIRGRPVSCLAESIAGYLHGDFQNTHWDKLRFRDPNMVYAWHHPDTPNCLNVGMRYDHEAFFAYWGFLRNLKKEAKKAEVGGFEELPNILQVDMFHLKYGLPRDVEILVRPGRILVPRRDPTAA